MKTIEKDDWKFSVDVEKTKEYYNTKRIKSKLKGMSPIEYKNNVKLSHAVQLLQSGHTLETVCETLSFLER